MLTSETYTLATVRSLVSYVEVPMVSGECVREDQVTWFSRQPACTTQTTRSHSKAEAGNVNPATPCGHNSGDRAFAYNV